MDIDTRRLANDEVYRKAIATQMGVDDVEVRPEKLDPRERLWREEVSSCLYRLLDIIESDTDHPARCYGEREYAALLKTVAEFAGHELDRVLTKGGKDG